MAVDLGTAYISVVPTTKDLDKGIRAALDGSVKHADKTGKDMGVRLASGVVTHMGKAGDKSGDAFAKGFTPKVASAGKSAMLGLSNLLVGSAQGVGSQVGGGIGGGIAAGISRSSGRVVDALSTVAVAGGNTLSSKLVTAGTVAAGGVALITTAAILAGKQLYELGSAWDDISDGIVIKTGLIGTELDKVKTSIKNVVTTTAAAPGDIANVAGQLIQTLGLQGSALETVTKQISDYNEMNDGSAINIRELSKMFKRFGVEGAASITDNLNKLKSVSQDTGIPINELISSLRSSADVGELFGLSMDGMINLMADFEKAGGEAASSLPMLKMAIVNLAEYKPGEDPRKALSEVNEELKNLLAAGKNQDAAELAKKIFGKQWTEALSLIKQGTANVDELNGKLIDVKSTIEEDRQATADWKEDFQILKNQMSERFAPIAEGAFDYVNNELRYLTGFLNKPKQLKVELDPESKRRLQAELDAFFAQYTAALGLPNVFAGADPNSSVPMVAPPGSSTVPSGSGLSSLFPFSGPSTTTSGGGGLLGGAFSTPNSGTMSGSPGRGFPQSNTYGGLIGNTGAISSPGNFNSGKASAYLDWKTIDAIAANSGLTMTSGYRDPNGPTLGGVPAWRSYHGSGRAHDYAGTPAQNAAFYNLMKSTYGPQLKELLYEDVGTANEHVHVAFASGGGINGPGTGTSDSIPAWLSNGEHVLTASDVKAMGGQGAVYAFRNALHRAGGGEADLIKLAAISGEDQGRPYGGRGADRKDPKDTGTPVDPIIGGTGPGLIPGPDWRVTGPSEDMKWWFPWWWDFWNSGKLDPLTPSGKIRKNIDMYGMPGFAGGGPYDSQLDQESVDTNTAILPTPNDQFEAQKSTGTGIFNPDMKKWLWYNRDQPGNFNPEMKIDLSHASSQIRDPNDKWNKMLLELAFGVSGGTRNKYGYWKPRGGKINGLAGGGSPEEELLKQQEMAQQQQAGFDPNAAFGPDPNVHQGSGGLPGPATHQGTGAPPGPDPNQPQAPNYLEDFKRSAGYSPGAAANTGVAGTSSLSKVIGLGNEVVSGLIDTGASLAQTAAAAAAGAGAISPEAGIAANIGIQIGASTLKRLSSYGFQLASIGADSLIAQLFPFGPPRWAGYDYTQFIPQTGFQQAALTTIEKMGKDKITNYFKPEQQPGQQQPQPTDAVLPPPSPMSPAAPDTPLSAADVSGSPTGSPFSPTAPPIQNAPAPTDPNILLPFMKAHGGSVSVYDQGGVLNPGDLALNMSKRPEKVLTDKQWNALSRIEPGSNGQQPLVKIDAIYGMSPEDVASKIESKQRLAMMRYSGRP